MYALYGFDFISFHLFLYIQNMAAHSMELVLIVFPTIGYIDQFKTLILTKNPKIFNLTSALILLTANFMKFLYWIYEPFLPYLLGQSLAVFVINFVMGIYSYKYSESATQHTTTHKRTIIRGYKTLFKVFHLITPYEFIGSMMIYAGIIAAIYYIMCLIFTLTKTNAILIILSNVIETTISLPLFKKVVIDRDIFTTSSVLLVQYVLGDLIKIIMFSFSKAGFAFLLGSYLQFSFDSFNFLVYLILKRCHYKISEEIEENLIPDKNVGVDGVA